MIATESIEDILVMREIKKRWRGMISRCHDESNKNYINYGGRGIGVCERWLVFENFYADMREGFHPNLWIERKKNDLGYSPDNCKWATPKEQGRNKRRVRLITCGDVTQTVSAWAEQLEIKPYNVVRNFEKTGNPATPAPRAKMGRPKLGPNELKGVLLEIRMKLEERDELKRLAKAEGVTLSAYVRGKLNLD